jgi:hypothetical protein
MAEIVQFRPRASYGSRQQENEPLEIDLVTAVDAAIRDLRDIVAAWGADSSLKQAEECRKMLEEALASAI